MEIALTATLSTSEIADERELNKAINKVKAFARRSAKAVYDLGGELKRIRDEELWTLRIDKKTGLGKYPGFWDFCRAEITISESYIRRLIDIHEQFDLKAVKKWGVARLSVAMRLPEYKRKGFLHRTKFVPACSPELRDLARQAQREEPAVTISKHFSAENKDTAEVADNPSPTPKRVTVSVPVGMQAQTMWARPRVNTAVGDPTKPATSMLDDPWAKFKLAPDVMAYVRLAHNETGGITAMLEIRQGRDTGATDGR